IKAMDAVEENPHIARAEKAMAQTETLYGKDSPQAAIAVERLSKLLKENNLRLDEAARLEQRVAEIQNGKGVVLEDNLESSPDLKVNIEAHRKEAGFFEKMNERKEREMKTIAVRLHHPSIFRRIPCFFVSLPYADELEERDVYPGWAKILRVCFS